MKKWWPPALFTVYLEKVVAQLPRLYVRGADVLAMQRPLEVEKWGIAIGVLHPSPVHQRLFHTRIPPGHDKHLHAVRAELTRFSSRYRNSRGVSNNYRSRHLREIIEAGLVRCCHF